MAAYADVDRVGLGKPRLPAGVRAVAVSAIPCCARVRNFGRLDQLGFIVMARYAQCLGVFLGKHHFSVLCRRMADFALLIGEWRMSEFRHQLGRCRLVRIVAAHAIGGFKGLILVRLLQGRILYVMAVDAKRRWSFGEMKVKLDFADLPVLCVT